MAQTRQIFTTILLIETEISFCIEFLFGYNLTFARNKLFKNVSGFTLGEKIILNQFSKCMKAFFLQS